MSNSILSAFLDSLQAGLQGVPALGLLLLVAAVVFLARLWDRVGRLEREVARLRRSGAAGPVQGPPAADPAAAPAVAAAPGAAPQPAAARGSAPAPQPARPAADAPAAATRDPFEPSPQPAAGPFAAPAAPAAPAGPFVPAPDAAPGLLERLFAGGNWLVRGGVLVLFLGVGFLLKFAADNALLPVHLRLAGVALASVVMVWLGIRLAPARRAYGLALQGGGMGLIYLTLYAALHLYGLLPAPATFVLMVAAVAGAGWLAVRQDALSLAVLGALGGFAAPLLASTGAGSHVLLFSYYALLNAGVLGLAVFRSWRALNLVGFAATFVVSALWGHRYYQAQHFATVEPFLVLFFAMYLGVAVLFAAARGLRLRDPLDSTLVFGTPLVAFGLQSRLTADMPYGLAWSALALAVVYAGSAWALWRRGPLALRVLVEAFAALAVGFVTVAVALAFDARWTAASWALEGAALVWVGWRQRRLLARLAGAALQVLAGAAWVWHGLGRSGWESGDWLGTLMLAGAGVLSGALLARTGQGPPGDDERALSPCLAIWGLAWWFGGGAAQILDVVAAARESGALLLFAAASAAALELGGGLARWSLPRATALLLPAALLVAAVAQAFVDPRPLASLAALGWPVALLTAAFVLRRRDADGGRLAEAGHAALVWLLAGLCAWELAWWFQHWLPPVRSWRRLAWLLAPAAVLAAVAAGSIRASGWPFATRATLYLVAGGGPVACVLAGGVFALSVGDPHGPWPWTYLPLLNPLDLGLLAAMAGGATWLRAAAGLLQAGNRNVLVVAGAGIAFAWLNGVLLRTLHFRAGIPYRFSAMLDSTLAQASLSVLWASTALVVMVGASRRASRTLWIAGAALMVVVVVKLLAVDLAGSGTIARIVSFISVGLLLMVVGYLAPVPPRREQA